MAIPVDTQYGKSWRMFVIFECCFFWFLNISIITGSVTKLHDVIVFCLQ